MAWTAPRTWVTGETVTAALLNTHVRDNFNVTATGIAASANEFLVSTGANVLAFRAAALASVGPSQTTTGTSYGDLATVGPAVTLTTGSRVIVYVTAALSNDTTGSRSKVGYVISGASSLGATDTRALLYDSSVADDFLRCTMVDARTDLTPGSNTFTLKYRVSANTGAFGDRQLLVFPLS